VSNYDASRAGIRTAGGSRPEGSIASRYFGGWSELGRTGDPGRARRRVSTARHTYYAWRRQAGSAQQRRRKAGSPGRTPFWDWMGLSSLSHAGLMEAAVKECIRVFWRTYLMYIIAIDNRVVITPTTSKRRPNDVRCINSSTICACFSSSEDCTWDAHTPDGLSDTP
jgi:hypothetical protein